MVTEERTLFLEPRGSRRKRRKWFRSWLGVFGAGGIVQLLSWLKEGKGGEQEEERSKWR